MKTPSIDKKSISFYNTNIRKYTDITISNQEFLTIEIFTKRNKNYLRRNFMKKLLFFTLFIGICMSGVASTKEKNPNLLKQVYKKEELITLDKQNVAGGNGTLHGKFAFTRDMATEEDAIKEIGWMTLNKGESVGVHPHKNNEDTYIIVSGEGIFTDGSGKETVVKAGDVTIARPNQSHGLRNEKDEPLVFLDIIAQNHALKIEK